MKVSSNVSAAQDAASGFAAIEVPPEGPQVNLRSSNIPSMQDAAQVAETMLRSTSQLIAGLKRQGDSVSSLATEIEARDRRDAATLHGKP